MYKIEEAMALEPELMGRDWSKRLSAKASSVLRQAAQKQYSITFIGTGSSYHAALWAHWLCTRASAGKVASRAITTWDFLAQADALKATTGARAKELFVAVSHRGNSGLT